MKQASTHTVKQSNQSYLSEVDLLKIETFGDLTNRKISDYSSSATKKKLKSTSLSNEQRLLESLGLTHCSLGDSDATFSLSEPKESPHESSNHISSSSRWTFDFDMLWEISDNDEFDEIIEFFQHDSLDTPKDENQEETTIIIKDSNSKLSRKEMKKSKKTKRRKKHRKNAKRRAPPKEIIVMETNSVYSRANQKGTSKDVDKTKKRARKERSKTRMFTSIPKEICIVKQIQSDECTGKDQDWFEEQSVQQKIIFDSAKESTPPIYSKTPVSSIKKVFRSIVGKRNHLSKKNKPSLCRMETGKDTEHANIEDEHIGDDSERKDVAFAKMKHLSKNLKLHFSRKRSSMPEQDFRKGVRTPWSIVNVFGVSTRSHYSTSSEESYSSQSQSCRGDVTKNSNEKTARLDKVRSNGIFRRHRKVPIRQVS